MVGQHDVAARDSKASALLKYRQCERERVFGAPSDFDDRLILDGVIAILHVRQADDMAQRGAVSSPDCFKEKEVTGLEGQLGVFLRQGSLSCSGRKFVVEFPPCIHIDPRVLWIKIW